MAGEAVDVGKGKVQLGRDFGYKDFLGGKQPCFSAHRNDHISAYSPAWWTSITVPIPAGHTFAVSPLPVNQPRGCIQTAAPLGSGPCWWTHGSLCSCSRNPGDSTNVTFWAMISRYSSPALVLRWRDVPFFPVFLLQAYLFLYCNKSLCFPWSRF